MAELLDRLADLEREFGDVEAQLADPDVFSDQTRYTALARRHKELDQVVTRGRELRARTDDLEIARELLTESTGDEREVVRAEIADAEAAIERLTAELQVLLLPKDPNDGRNVIVEIRGAEGGEEANLFARDLFEMYRAYAARQAWSLEVLGAEPSDLGGYTSVTFLAKGDGVWTRLKHEGGPHRVQRVPVTESQAVSYTHLTLPTKA